MVRPRQRVSGELPAAALRGNTLLVDMDSDVARLVEAPGGTRVERRVFCWAAAALAAVGRRDSSPGVQPVRRRHGPLNASLFNPDLLGLGRRAGLGPRACTVPALCIENGS